MGSSAKMIYFLSDYNWRYGEVVSSGPKNNKIRVPAQGWLREHEVVVPKEKCAIPGEEVCVVWETWKGKNGRGGYRIERELYPESRVEAGKVHYQHIGHNALGRITESSYGVKR